MTEDAATDADSREKPQETPPKKRRGRPPKIEAIKKNAIALRKPLEERQLWPTRIDAARRLGVSIGTIKRLQARGEITPVLVDGSWRFDPAELDTLETHPGATGEIGVNDLLAAATALTRQSHAHVEKLVDLITSPVGRLLEAASEENKILQHRIGELEKKNGEMLEQAEASLSLAHERSIREAEFEASEIRKQRGFALAERYLPHVVASLAKKNAPGQPSAMLLPVADFIGSLTDAQMQALTASGFLAQDQAALLNEIRSGLRKGNESGSQREPKPEPAPVSGVSP
jgi:hypothetical protein